MKQKLLVAIGLLAAAGVFLALRSDSLPWEVARPAAVEGLSPASSPDSATNGAASADADASRSALPDGKELSQPASRLGDTANRNWGAGNALMQQAAERILKSPPLVADGLLAIDAFDARIEGAVKFLWQGAGLPHSRTEYTFELAAGRREFIHISTQDFAFLLQHSGDEEQLEFVDRRQLRRDGHSPLGLQTGCLTALLQQLAEQMDWSQAEELALPLAAGQPEVAVLRMEGRWRQAAVEQYFPESLPASPEPASAQSADGPGGDPGRVFETMPQVPERVVVWLARGPAWELFPYRVDFLKRRATPGVVERLVNQTTGAERPPFRTVWTISLSELRRVAAIPDEFFQVEPGVYEPRDRTTFYRRELERLGRLPPPAGTR